MTITLASYNLQLHKAYSELSEIADNHRIDILCLQECRSRKLHDQIGYLKLASTSQIGMVCNAIYYDPSKFKTVGRTQNIKLPKPLYEYLGLHPVFRLQVESFKSVKNSQNVIIGNIHLSHLVARNYSRKKQAAYAMDFLRKYSKDAPTIVAGDFNYPSPDVDLRNIARDFGFHECGKDLDYQTHKSRLFGGKFDRIFVSNSVTEKQTKVLEFGASDHAAIITKTSV